MSAQLRSIPFSPVDTAWWHMEDPTNLMMITGVWTFDTPVDIALVRRLTEERLLRYDRFRMRVVRSRIPGGLPHWEDDPHFDLASHLHHIALPGAGDRGQLQTLVSDLMSTPLDYSKPLWQLHLVDNVEGGSAVVHRLHHCIADGIALVRLMLSLTDEELVPLPSEGGHRADDHHLPLVPRRVVRAASTAAHAGSALAHEGREVLAHPGHVADAARWGARHAGALSHLLLMPPDPPTPFKGPLGVAKRAAWSTHIPLDDVKAIGHAHGATVNDVLLTAVAGALRTYMLGRGDSVEGLDIRAVVPVNLRSLEGPVELGNKFTLAFLPLPIGIADTRERLAELKRRMDGIKGSAEPAVGYAILNGIGVAPTEVESLVVDIFGTKATAVMTNVPGPRRPLHYGGHVIRDLMSWVPQSGRLGLGVSILSYAGSVLLGVATDAGLVPDPQTIVDAFHDEFGEMSWRMGRERTHPRRPAHAPEALRTAPPHRTPARRAASHAATPHGNGSGTRQAAHAVVRGRRG